MSRFVLLIGGLILLAIVSQTNFIWYIVYSCIAIYVWVWWSVPRAMSRLYCGRSYNRYAFWGETVPITVQLQNRGWLPMPWVQLSETIAVQLRQGSNSQAVLALAPKKSAQFTYQIQARQRGYYQIGPLHITSGDLFGLRPEVTAQLPADYLTIYPRITPLAEWGLPSRLPFGTLSSQQRLLEDPQRPLGVRQFRSGDSLRQINWKASAHTQQLLVKTFAPAISLQTAVLLDLHLGSYQRQSRQQSCEWGIELAASIAAYLIDQRQSVGLLSNGFDPLASVEAAQFDQQSGRLLAQTAVSQPHSRPTVAIPVNHGRGHLIKILEQLARIEADNNQPVAAWAQQATAQLSWGTTVLLITANGNDAVCQTLQRLLRSGFNPILITIEPDTQFNRVRERARQAGFRAYQIHDPQALAQWPHSQPVAPL